MNEYGTTEKGLIMGKGCEPTSITFTLDGEEWVCHDIKTLKELVEKFQAYANRDEYVRQLEERIKHLERIL